MKSMNIEDIKTQAEFDEAKAAFIAQHPELPKLKPIERMNLIMRKEFALQILKGEKKVEFRAFSQHYTDRLMDKDVANWMADHQEKEVDYFGITSTRPVSVIHFHNYSNSWFLDVECTQNEVCAPLPHWVEFFNTLNCHELDEMTADFEKRNEEMRPLFFYFVCGKVIDTNLKI